MLDKKYIEMALTFYKNKPEKEDFDGYILWTFSVMQCSLALKIDESEFFRIALDGEA